MPGNKEESLPLEFREDIRTHYGAPGRGLAGNEKAEIAERLMPYFSSGLKKKAVLFNVLIMIFRKIKPVTNSWESRRGLPSPKVDNLKANFGSELRRLRQPSDDHRLV